MQTQNLKPYPYSAIINNQKKIQELNDKIVGINDIIADLMVMIRKMNRITTMNQPERVDHEVLRTYRQRRRAKA